MLVSISRKLSKYSVKLINVQFYYSRSLSSKNGLVIGVTKAKEGFQLSSYGKKFNESINGKLVEQLLVSGPIEPGQARIFWGLGDYMAVAVAGLPSDEYWHALDQINVKKENIRIASGIGAKALQELGVEKISVDDFGSPQSAAEGASLGIFKYQGQKSKKDIYPKLSLAEETTDYNEWNKGIIYGNAQNWARFVTESPANIMTPTALAQEISTILKNNNCAVEIHHENWIKKQKMEAFLAVTRGSVEPPVFLEIIYNGDPENYPNCACLIGKGITFDSGGISLKPGKDMNKMRGDMGGAAVVAAAISALGQLQVPINIRGYIPLCENLPSGTAVKPGDVVFARNGSSICIENTDAEGRLILADTLCYSSVAKPSFIIDVATLTGAISVGLGDCVSGAFCNSEDLWEQLHDSGKETGDRVWRMPLFKHYSRRISNYAAYDLSNMGKGTGAGSCKAAAFLREFVPEKTPWAHIDIAGVAFSTTDQPYLQSTVMTGRPTRTLIEFMTRAADITN